MTFRLLKIVLPLVLISSTAVFPAAPAPSFDLEALIRELHAVPAVTGNEEWLAAKIAAKLPKTYLLEKDNLGGLYAWPDNKKPNGKFAILAPLDEFGYVVSGFTSDGFLRLDRASNPPSPVYDSFLIGHPVVIRNAWVPANGIVAQPAMHVLSRELRDRISGSFSLDLVYVDVGVRTEDEARKKGFAILDPVSLYPDYVTLAGTKRAGPNLGRKALAAALTGAALSAVPGRPKNDNPTVLAWPAQTRLAARGGGRGSLGMTRAAHVLGVPAVVVLEAAAVTADAKSPVLGKGPVLVLLKDAPQPLRAAVERVAAKEKISLQTVIVTQAPLLSPFPKDDGKEAVGLAIPVKFAGTPSETVDLADVEALSRILTRLIVEGPGWIEGGVR